MVDWIPTFIALLSVFVIGVMWKTWRRAIRMEHIREYILPKGIFDRLRKKHPQLTIKDCQLVAQALRQYFLVYLKSGRRPVSMPSQVVDDLWHEFILHTKIYTRFCSKAFGRFMHHTPAAVLGTVQEQNIGLKRCWRYACREEGINPARPTRLPLLFAIDGKLLIKDGFQYAVDCGAIGRLTKEGQPVHCGADLAVGCGGSGADGIFDTTSDNGCTGDSGCSGGCGGD